MEKITYKNQEGVFIPIDEFTFLQEKILAQRKMIDELQEEMEL